MSTITTYDLGSGKTGEREFSADLGEALLYRTMKDAVVMYQSNSRQGDAHVKTRGELQGHTAKPWKQKGTGRARAGDRRSPLWVGGATTFGPRNTRRWYYSLPKRQRNVALRSALLGKLVDREVTEVSGLSFDKPSSKIARQVLQGCNVVNGSVLVLTAAHDDNTYRSFRNFPRVTVMTGADSNAYELLAHKNVIAQEGALEAMIARF
ncbi:MAG: 50S ribosomal protein L4 [Planctomycetota bacterium]|jgi:large subunit ribosomal protein L4|nr:50S ribosomal protein L4 [Planctomycetota bacterium]MDG2310720.1 50S ribosomal protein L4 [Planctomycetota bacterium]